MAKTSIAVITNCVKNLVNVILSYKLPDVKGFFLKTRCKYEYFMSLCLNMIPNISYLIDGACLIIASNRLIYPSTRFFEWFSCRWQDATYNDDTREWTDINRQTTYLDRESIDQL